MKKLVLLTFAIIVFILSASAVCVYADELLLDAELISDGKLIPTHTNMPSQVKVQSINSDLYNIILKGLSNMNTSIDVSSLDFSVKDENDIAELKDTYNDVVNQNPELFYIETQYGVYYNTRTYKITHIIPTYAQNAAEMKVLFEQKTAEILSKTVKEGMTDEEILLSIHDYIVCESEYNYGKQTQDDHSAYGIIVKKTGVCQSYSLAYNYLLSLVGIESRFCASDSMGHGWSMVKLNENWYHIDPTWDDPNWDSEGLNNMGLILHDYFLLSDKGITNRSHYGWQTDIVCSDATYEAGYPFNTDEARTVQINPATYYPDYKPFYQYNYNAKDGLFYSRLFAQEYEVYYRTNFNGDKFEYITKDEYNHVTALPDGVSAYDVINLAGKKMTFADKNNLSNAYVTFENNGDEASGTLLVALYDSKSRLISCKTESITLPANTATAVKISPAPADNIKTGKVLLWNTDTLTEILNTAVEF